jgi:hypothetical protein
MNGMSAWFKVVSSSSRTLRLGAIALVVLGVASTAACTAGSDGTDSSSNDLAGNDAFSKLPLHNRGEAPKGGTMLLK